MQTSEGREQGISERNRKMNKKGGAEMAYKQCGCFRTCVHRWISEVTVTMYLWAEDRVTLSSVTLIHCTWPTKSLSLKQGSLALHYSVMLLIWCLRGGHSESQLAVIIRQVQQNTPKMAF